MGIDLPFGRCLPCLEEAGPGLNLLPFMSGTDTAKLVGTGPNAPILVADDDSNDVMLLQIAWAKAGLKCPLQVVRDGAQAIQYLAGEERFADRREFPLPRLVLMDLKMPLCDGFTVLSWIREQPWLKGLAVVILSSSADPDDVERAYALGASSYTVKPGSTEELRTLVRCLNDWWLEISLHPRLDAGPPP